jgi:hypothetical protein
VEPLEIKLTDLIPYLVLIFLLAVVEVQVRAQTVVLVAVVGEVVLHLPVVQAILRPLLHHKEITAAVDSAEVYFLALVGAVALDLLELMVPLLMEAMVVLEQHHQSQAHQ